MLSVCKRAKGHISGEGTTSFCSGTKFHPPFQMYTSFSHRSAVRSLCTVSFFLLHIFVKGVGKNIFLLFHSANKCGTNVTLLFDLKTLCIESYKESRL